MGKESERECIYMYISTSIQKNGYIFTFLYTKILLINYIPIKFFEIIFLIKEKP